VLCGEAGTLVFGSHVALVHCPANSVEVDEEWLREVGLDTPGLVVDVVVSSIVGEEPVNRVVGECVAAVVKNCLDSRTGEKPHGLSHRHACEQIAQTSTQRIEGETFERVVVQSAVGIWDVETVVA